MKYALKLSSSIPQHSTWPATACPLSLPLQAWLAGELIVRCERGGLTCLPAQLFFKTTVRQLILSHNALNSIPQDIQLLKLLQVLKLGHNQLREVPEELCHLEHLEKLELQNNLLESVPRGLCRYVTGASADTVAFVLIHLSNSAMSGHGTMFQVGRQMLVV